MNTGRVKLALAIAAFSLLHNSRAGDLLKDQLEITIDLKSQQESTEVLDFKVFVSDELKAKRLRSIRRVLKHQSQLISGCTAELQRNRIITKVKPKFDGRICNINFPELKVGDIVRYSIATSRAITEDFPKFYAVIDPSKYSEFEKVSWRISSPKGIRIYSSKLKTLKAMSNIDGNVLEFSFHPRNSAKIGESSPYIDGSKMFVSSYKDYSEFALHYAQVLRINPERLTQVDRILNDLKINQYRKNEDKISLLYGWVQSKFSYTSEFLNLKSGRVRDLSEILQTQSGDCKDHVVLLQALLGRAGIDSYPVLVALADQQALPKVVYPDIFNHLILYVPSVGKFIDPSDKNATVDSLSPRIQGKSAVSISEQPTIVSLPKDEIQKNVFVTDTVVNYQKNNYVKGLINIHTTGEPARELRKVSQIFSGLDQSALFRKQLESGGINEGSGAINFAKNKTGAYGANIVFSGRTSLSKEFRVTPKTLTQLSFSLQRFATGGFAVAVGEVSGCRPISVIETYSLHFPSFVKGARLPIPVIASIDDISFRTTYRLENSTIKIERKLNIEVNEKNCRGDFTKSLQSLMQTVASDLQEEVIVSLDLS